MEYSLSDWLLTIGAILGVMAFYLGTIIMSIGVWYYEEENKRK